MNNIAFALTIFDGYPLDIIKKFIKKRYAIFTLHNAQGRRHAIKIRLTLALLYICHATLGLSFLRVATLPFILNLHHHFCMFYHFHVLFRPPQKGMPLLHWQLVCKDYKRFNVKKAFHLNSEEIVQDSTCAQIGPPSHWTFSQLPINWT